MERVVLQIDLGHFLRGDFAMNGFPLGGLGDRSRFALSWEPETLGLEEWRGEHPDIIVTTKPAATEGRFFTRLGCHPPILA